MVAAEWKIGRDRSMGLGNMGSDDDHNRSHFNGIMKIEVKFKYVEASLGGTKEKTVNPITAFEFCYERQRDRLWCGVQGSGLHLTAFLL